MTFFFDNNWSPDYVSALSALGEDVEHLRASFPPHMPDEDWIPVIGERKWALVTLDLRIVRNPQQRVVLESDQFTWLVRAWPNIKKQAATAPAAATYRVKHKNHKVELWQ